jgi:putative DNA primase/helicase
MALLLIIIQFMKELIKSNRLYKKKYKRNTKKNTTKLEKDLVNNISTEVVEANQIDVVIDAKLSNSSVADILTDFLLKIKQTTLQKAAGIHDDTKLSDKLKIVIVIDYLVQEVKKYGFDLARKDDCFYVFTGEYWMKIEQDDLKSFLGRVAPKVGVDYLLSKHHNFREDLLKQFQSEVYFPTPDLGEKTTKINLNNGTFVISTLSSSLKPFNKSDFMRYKLPFSYDPIAKCPKFKAYLNRVIPDIEKQNVIAEYFGYSFIPNSVLKLEKSLILYGNGANGKSVLFDIVQQLFGSTNISNYSLQSLTDSKSYTRSNLSGKLLNYASEISSKMNPTIFKQLVSGEPVEARMIYGKPFILSDYARMVFNTNVLPNDIENNSGFFRRFIIVDFDQTIQNEEKNPMLANEIIREELPGVFNWILEGLERLLEQGDFTKCIACINTVERYRKDSDSVALFLEENNYVSSMDDILSLQILYKQYKDFCIDFKYNTCSYKSFSARLKSNGYNITRQSSGRIVGIKKES